MRQTRAPDGVRIHASSPRPPDGLSKIHITQRLGDSIHAYAVMTAIAAEGRAHSFVVYRPFAGLFAGGPLAVVPNDQGTQWWSMPRAFRGPQHGEHVRDTMAAAAGITDRSLLHIDLAAAPVRRPAHSYIVLCPNAGASYKEWLSDRWGAVVEFLLSRGLDVFICGQPGQPRIAAPAGATHLDCGITQLASLVAGARALIGPDSGHLHLADALGIPTIGLYGATSSLTYGPYRDRTLCIDTHAEHPFPQGAYSSARHRPGGMSTMPVERVLEIISHAKLWQESTVCGNPLSGQEIGPVDLKAQQIGPSFQRRTFQRPGGGSNRNPPTRPNSLPNPRVAILTTKAELPALSPASLSATNKTSRAPERTAQVSVIMPVFNGGKLLDRAVESLRRQTFSNWEMLAIDDGSTDDTHERLLRWSRQDPRIRVLRLPENRGPAAARNEGLRHAVGTMVAYLDHDDEYYEDYLERVQRFRGRADVLVFRYDTIRDDRAAEFQAATKSPLARHKQIFTRNIATPLGIAHRRSLWRRVGGFDERLRYQFDERLRYQEDWDLWKRFARAGASFLYLPDCSGIYHVRLDSLSRGQMAKRGRFQNPRAT